MLANSPAYKKHIFEPLNAYQSADQDKMGFRIIILKMPTAYTDEAVKKQISKQLNIKDFSWQIQRKSLDARNKRFIHWRLETAVHSPEIKGGEGPGQQELQIPYKAGRGKVIVVGSGPAGMFCALVLQKAGFEVCLIERGSEVTIRSSAIRQFEKNGTFNASNNYAFGEGGAGTFSDGKLTSRPKHISAERAFILNTYIEAGAPPEIAYMTHPHLGTDNLRKIVVNLRDALKFEGGRIKFDTLFQDISLRSATVEGILTSAGTMEADAVFLATGHSAYDTFRMLIRRGVAFRTKRFALGSRMEHPQELINQAQWGKAGLPGVKAAEYRLTSAGDGMHQVYSFCMCPGGIVVPAAAYGHTNIVNGMSYYNRNGQFANAACVAGLHPDELAEKTIPVEEALDLIESLEQSFYAQAGGYQAPAMQIADFIAGKPSQKLSDSSFPLGLLNAPLYTMLPATVTAAMQAGLKDFSSRIKGFETGTLIGLESKTSSPVQVLRNESGLCTGFENLYMIGEGSGYAGGIVSSAADGVRAAMKLLQRLDHC